jgi:hypothetical protein
MAGAATTAALKEFGSACGTAGGFTSAVIDAAYSTRVALPR